jgi:hypothetical protein
LIKSLDIRWGAMVIAVLTIVGSYNFIAASVSYGQWLSDTVFLASAQLLIVCIMAAMVFVRPRLTLMLCWVYVALVVVEIFVYFSDYFWIGFESQPKKDGSVTLRLINRDWSYHLVALLLALLMLILGYKNKK